MRYDLVVNTMVKTALTERRIVVNNPSLWRPIIDVLDVAHAYIRALDADLSVTGIFNIAYDNFTIGRLADEVAEALREYDIQVPIEIHRRRDLRSYRVSLRKAQEVLDFHPRVSVRDSVQTMMRHILEGRTADLDNPRYRNVDWLRMKMQEERLVVGPFVL